MFELIDAILDSPVGIPGRIIGHSRDNRPIHAAVLGQGKIKISLIGGCHADEPVGPRFLRKFFTYLDSLAPTHPLLQNYQWWLVPHANPDGEVLNKRWYTDADTTFVLVDYLRFAVRERPGDDIEFGFPDPPHRPGLRPENTAIYDFWKSAETPFHLHASLHGMMTAAGPWFLMEKEWIDRSGMMRNLCREETAKMNYALHDVDRRGEKGFFRIDEGFCTRPDSKAMRAFFMERNDRETADKFFPSSMETVRGLGGDPLTIVSEMPLFILPDLPETMMWPNPVWEQWQRRLADWKARLLANPGAADEIRIEIKTAGIIAMPVHDQMRLQWRYITAAIGRLNGEYRG